MITFALVSDTKAVSLYDLQILSEVMQHSAYHCADIWGLKPPMVIAVDRFHELSEQRNVHPILFTESEAPEGVLGYHYWDVFRHGPASRVFVGAASGLKSGSHSLSETCSHEIVEAMTDPQVNIWREWPGRDIQMAFEIADMSQRSYIHLHRGEKWQLANFVTPEYFDSRYLDDSARKRFLDGAGRFDYMREFDHPGQIGDYGYAIIRRTPGSVPGVRYGRLWRRNSELSKAKQSTWARSYLRGAHIA